MLIHCRHFLYWFMQFWLCWLFLQPTVVFAFEGYSFNKDYKDTQQSTNRGLNVSGGESLPGLLRLEGYINGDKLHFKVSKKDGTPFKGWGSVRVHVQEPKYSDCKYDIADERYSAKRINSGEYDHTFPPHDMDNYQSLPYPKSFCAYYKSFSRDDTSGEYTELWVGMLTVHYNPPQPKDPDLYISNFSLQKTTVSVGESFLLRATVKNQGSGAANSTRLNYYRSENSTISSNDTRIANDSVSSLSSGRTADESAGVNISQSGTFYVGACVESVSGESNTANNCTDGYRITVNRPQPKHPDFIVNDISISSTEVKPGESFTINVAVQNVGNADSHSTNVIYYASTDTVIDGRGDDSKLQDDRVNSLDINEIGYENQSVRIYDPGTYYIGACVERDPDEVQLSNNCSRGIRLNVKEEVKLSITRDSIDFDSVEVGQTGSARSIGLTNLSSQTTISIDRLPTIDGFTLQSGCSTLEAGERCWITVDFAPIANKSYRETLVINSSADNSPLRVILEGIGIAAPQLATMRITPPTQLNFSRTVVNQQSTPQIISIHNDGNADLTINGVTPPNGFQISSNGCRTVIPRGSCAIELVFTPTNPQPYSGTLNISSNSQPVPSMPILTGEGFENQIAELQVTPSRLDFDPTQINQTSGPKQLTVANIGNKALTFQNMVVPTGFSVDRQQCPDTLAASASCVVDVTFSPTAVTAYAEELRIESDAKNPVVTVALAGQGTAIPTAGLTVSRAGVGAGTISADPAGLVCDISIHSHCQARYAVGTTVKLTVTPADGFTFTQWTGACTGKSLETTVLLDTDKQCNAEFTQLSADLVLTPSTPQDFGTVEVGQASEPKAFTVQNNGNVAASLTDANIYSIANNLSSEFEIQDVNVCLSQPIAASGQQCAFNVVFKPTVGDSFSHYLSLKTAVGALPTVQMKGVGEILETVFRLVATKYPTDGVKPGQQFDITFQFVPDTGRKPDGVLISLNYDTSKLNALEITNSGVFEFEFLKEIDDATGIINFAASNFEGTVPEEAFDLFTVTFEAEDTVTPGDSTILSFSEDNSFTSNSEFINISSDEIEINFISNAIRVYPLWDKHVDEPETEWVIPSFYWLDADMSNSDPEEVSLQSDGSFELEANISEGTHCLIVKGSNTLSQVVEFSIPYAGDSIYMDKPLVVGDILNSDNAIKTLDVEEIFKFLNGMTEINLKDHPDDYDAFYDVNADGRIYVGNKATKDFSDEGDAAWIGSILNQEMMNRLPAERMKVLSNGIFGNTACSSSSISRESRSLRSALRNSGSVSISTNPVEFLPVNSTQTIDVYVNAKSATKILSASAFLDFDPNAIQVKQITMNVDHFGFITFSEFDNQAGQIFVSAIAVGEAKDKMLDKVRLMSIEIETVVENGEQTLKFNSAAGQYVSIEEYTNNFTIRDAKVIFNTPDSIGKPGEIPQCPVYAIQDNGVNDSQFFVIDPITRETTLLGILHAGADVEGLAIHPQTGELYGSSGDKTEQKGTLFHINKLTGEKTLIGATGFKEVDSIAFDPSGTLWGEAVGKGIIQIDLETGQGELMIPFAGKVEDMTFSLDGKTLYAAQDRIIWAFDGENATVQCNSLPGAIEALEIIPGNALMFAFHHDKRAFIHVVDLATCAVLLEQGLPTGFNDIEGLAWWPSCLTETQ